jgi:GH24 family phage-related lysozyme (muramidase)
LAGTNLLKDLNRGDFDGAVKEMNIATSGGVYSRGLNNRRNDEHNIFNNGIYKMHR